MTALIVATRNQQGKGGASANDGHVIGYTEASGQFPRGHASWRPRRNRNLAISWVTGLFQPTARGYKHAYRGVAKFTPTCGAAWVAGTVAGVKTAVVVTHLMNNAFGPDLRGRRKLRRSLWTKGLVVAMEVVHELQEQGYRVFLVGDFNRHERGFVPGMIDSAGTHRPAPYDRVFCTRDVRIVGVCRGPMLGADHLSYSAAADLDPRRP